MKRLAILLATGLAAGTMAAGCSSQGGGARAESGLSVFHTRCSRCHGADGRGSAVFNTPTLPISRLSEEEMARVVTTGRNKMPSFSLELTPEQIKAVARYVKNDLPR